MPKFYTSTRLILFLHMLEVRELTAEPCCKALVTLSRAPSAAHTASSPAIPVYSQAVILADTLHEFGLHFNMEPKELGSYICVCIFTHIYI